MGTTNVEQLQRPASLPPQVGMTWAELDRFLAHPRVAVLSWTTPSGQVAATPIWFRYQDGVFLLHAAHPSPKTIAIQRNGHVALLIQDTEPPYRYVAVRGHACIVFDAAEARRLYERDALSYYGRLTGRLHLRYAQRLEDERNRPTQEVIIEITPTKIIAMDGRTALTSAQLLGLRVLRALGL